MSPGFPNSKRSYTPVVRVQTLVKEFKARQPPVTELQATVDACMERFEDQEAAQERQRREQASKVGDAPRPARLDSP
jgi:Skp family chaperone for outer membrane proteins